MKHLEISQFPALEYACNEALNTLSTNISYCGADIKTIMVTSRYALEGKSYISMNLMRTMATLKKRVVLVDADLRRSGIIGQFKLRYPAGSKPQGLADYLAGLCELEDVLYATNIDGAYLIPAGREVSSSLQLISSPRFEKMIGFLNEHFDYVIVDTPPAGVIVDAIAVAKFCDGALVAVSYNRGRRQEIAEVVESINVTGCRVLGAVLNNVEFGTYRNRKYYYSSGRYSAYYTKNYYASSYVPHDNLKKRRRSGESKKPK